MDLWTRAGSGADAATSGGAGTDANASEGAAELCATHKHKMATAIKGSEALFWIIVLMEDPTMTHYKISNRGNWYLIKSIMPCI